MPAPVPLKTVMASLHVTPPSVERLTETSPWEMCASALAAGVLELRHQRRVVLLVERGDGSPAPLPLRIGIWPSIQVAPPSNDVKNPVGT